MIIEKQFDNSKLEHPCVTSRHITELLRCPYFMNKHINYTKDMNQIKMYVKQFLQKVQAYFQKKGDAASLSILQSNLFEKMNVFFDSSPDLERLFWFGPVVIRNPKLGRRSRSKRKSM